MKRHGNKINYALDHRTVPYGIHRPDKLTIFFQHDETERCNIPQIGGVFDSNDKLPRPSIQIEGTGSAPVSGGAAQCVEYDHRIFAVPQRTVGAGLHTVCLQLRENRNSPRIIALGDTVQHFLLCEICAVQKFLKIVGGFRAVFGWRGLS